MADAPQYVPFPELWRGQGRSINGTLYPIEIKAKSNPTRNDGRGIGAFRECFPKERIGPGLIVCAVEKPLRLADNLMAVPWWEI